MQEHFAEFVADGATPEQIEFVQMVIEHLTANGIMDPGLLYESPFADQAPDGPDGVFDEDRVVSLFERVRAVNEGAAVRATG
jgi:type I restriction enzyme R subunit